MSGPLIRECNDIQNPSEDTNLEHFEMDLRLGLLIDRRTDSNLPDTIPIQFERVTRDGWKGINPFDVSGTDNYDAFLASADKITVSIVYADGGQEKLVKEPRWARLDFAKYVEFSQTGFLEMRWLHSPFEHYEVRRFDGTVWSFLPCEGPIVHCYLTDYRDRRGGELKFERGDQRRLLRLASPSGKWLQVGYDSTGRIAAITDSTGRTVAKRRQQGL